MGELDGFRRRRIDMDENIRAYYVKKGKFVGLPIFVARAGVGLSICQFLEPPTILLFLWHSSTARIFMLY